MSFTLAKLRRVLLSSPFKLVYSILVLLNHFTFGINVNILGATIVDLRFIYHVDVETISYIPVCVGIGYLIGALAGFLYKWLNRQLMLSLFVTFMGATIALVPHYGQLGIALPALVFNGIGAGAWDSGSGAWAIEMWPVGNDLMLQLVQFMYGCGSVVAPLLVAPYIYGEKTWIYHNDTGINRTITAEDRIHSLTLPFAGVGVALLIVPVIMFTLFLVHRYEKPPPLPPTTSGITKVDTEGNVMNRPSRRISSMPFRIIKLAMCGLALSCYATAELGWFGFSTAMYQYLPVEMAASSAAHVQSILSATFSCGRLLTAFITLKLVPDIIISYHYAISFTALATLYFGQDSELAIYIGSAMLGYGYSAMWPSILALAERHLKLSDRVYSCYSFLTGLMSMVIPLVLGQISLKVHPQTLFLLDGLFLCISFSMFVSVRLWIWKDGSRANGKY